MMFSSILMALPLVDFEHVILGNIKAPAHFLVVLTPSALERCDEPADWLRREIETALDIQRNIEHLMLEGFLHQRRFTRICWTVHRGNR
jgi:hypothetical protein